MVPAHKTVNASPSAHAGKSGQLTDEAGAVNQLKAILAIPAFRAAGHNGVSYSTLQTGYGSPKDRAMKKLPVLLAMMAVPLSGCAMQQGDFPSLQKRPYEGEPVIDESAPPVPAASPLSADVQAKLDAAVAQSRTAHDRFLAKLPQVRSRVEAARGAAVSSESWVVAQMELAALEMTRSPSVEALADMDRLYLQQLETELAGPADGSTAIMAQQQQIERQVGDQQAAIDGLKDMVR